MTGHDGASCPLCDAVCPEVRERHGAFHLRWCAACDLQFADPLREAGRDFYEQDALHCGTEVLYTSPLALNWDQRVFLRDRPCPGGALLDVGCGAGHFAAAAVRAGYRVTGLDISEAHLDLARRRFGLTDLHRGTLGDLVATSPPRRFDVVAAFQVLEHVADPVRFVADAVRLVAPGGYLAVGVPNWRVWPAFRAPGDAPPNHLTRWSRRSLARVLERAGLEVLQLREHRSAYGWLLRHLRLGLLRRAMQGSAVDAVSPGGPRPAVLALSVAKTRALVALDLPVRLVLSLVGAPGDLLYALARIRA